MNLLPSSPSSTYYLLALNCAQIHLKQGPQIGGRTIKTQKGKMLGTLEWAVTGAYIDCSLAPEKEGCKAVKGMRQTNDWFWPYAIIFVHGMHLTQITILLKQVVL